MFQALGNHAEGQRLNASDGLVPVLTVRHDARQRGHFGQPTAVDFSLNFNRERHKSNVPSGPAVEQGDGPDAARAALAPRTAQVIANPLDGPKKH